MITRYFLLPHPITPEVHAFYEACHKQGYPGNNLSVTVKGDQCLVKVTCNDEMHPQGVTPIEVLNKAGAEALLESWSAML